MPGGDDLPHVLRADSRFPNEKPRRRIGPTVACFAARCVRRGWEHELTTLANAVARRTVLLVEDDVDAREIYATTLRYAGYHVIEAPTIKDAEDVVRGLRPDVVVLDCTLPDGDGSTLVNRWRDHVMGGVPVIVVTAHRERQDIDAAGPCRRRLLRAETVRR